MNNIDEMIQRKLNFAIDSFEKINEKLEYNLEFNNFHDVKLELLILKEYITYVLEHLKDNTSILEKIKKND